MEDDYSLNLAEFDFCDIVDYTNQNFAYDVDTITDLTPMAEIGQSMDAVSCSNPKTEAQVLQIQDPNPKHKIVSVIYENQARNSITHGHTSHQRHNSAQIHETEFTTQQKTALPVAISKDSDPIKVTDFKVKFNAMDKICSSTTKWQVNANIVSQIKEQDKKFGDAQNLVPKLVTIKKKQSTKSQLNVKSASANNIPLSRSKYKQLKIMVDNLMLNEGFTTPHHRKLSHNLMFDIQVEIARLNQVNIGNILHMYLCSTIKEHESS